MFTSSFQSNVDHYSLPVEMILTSYSREVDEKMLSHAVPCGSDSSGGLEVLMLTFFIERMLIFPKYLQLEITIEIVWDFRNPGQCFIMQA